MFENKYIVNHFPIQFIQDILTLYIHKLLSVYGDCVTGYGVFSNGKTTFINASVCNDQYRPVHEPVVFDFPLPPGYCQGDFMKLSLETLQEQRLLSGSFMKTRKKETAFNMTKIEKVINGIDAQTASD